MIAPKPLNRPLVLGHRGASAHAGDNSIEAFELAVANGADGVEVDVRFTADGQVVLHHDPDIGEMGPLVHHEFATIRATHPEIPTLDEALTVLDDLIINVEIKNWPFDPDYDSTHEMAGAIARWIALHDIHDRVLVTSFNPETMDAVRAADSAIATGQLISAGFEIAPPATDDIAAAGNRWLAASVADVLANPARAVAVTEEAGLRLLVWTVDDPGAIVELAGAGVDVLVCNDPGAALSLLGDS